MVDQRWTLTYDTMATGVKNYGRESLLSLGNGFLGWRGALVTTTSVMIHTLGCMRPVFLIRRQHRWPAAKW